MVPDSLDADGPALTNAGLFALGCSPEESDLILVPAPWEVTVSYRSGTALGPRCILEASPQLDLYDPDLPGAWARGVCMVDAPEGVEQRARALRALARTQIERQEAGLAPDEAALDTINAGCDALHDAVEATCAAHLDAGRLVGVIGGEHSAPLGLLRALAARLPGFGILQIDAHADLRPGFEGFDTSHASIMHHALGLPQIERVVQVGVRDLCGQEARAVEDSGGRVVSFYDWDLQAGRFEGTTWAAQVERILAPLPEAVYISFDIDGLEPALCPGTGTPVPGGLSFAQAAYLVRALARTGRRVAGFDLCEVAPGGHDINGIVGARVLWQLALATFLTNPTRRPGPDPDASLSTP